MSEYFRPSFHVLDILAAFSKDDHITENQYPVLSIVASFHFKKSEILPHVVAFINNLTMECIQGVKEALDRNWLKYSTFTGLPEESFEGFVTCVSSLRPS